MGLFVLLVNERAQPEPPPLAASTLATVEPAVAVVAAATAAATAALDRCLLNLRNLCDLFDHG